MYAQSIYDSQEQYYQVGDYTIDIQGKLGQGQQGTVFRAQHPNYQDLCCKVIQNKMRNNQLEQELKIMKRVQQKQCENLVIVYDIVDLPKQYEEIYIFMEACDMDLEKYLKEQLQNPDYLTIDQMKEIINQIISGYQVLRDLKIIHRDLKPENILVKMKNGRVVIKIADFGVGKILEQSSAVTKAGTPIYQAPEILLKDQKISAQNQTPYTDQCDIYSLGIILYRMVFKLEFPIKNVTTVPQLQKALRDFKETPFRVPKKEDIPKQLRDLIENMLKFEPTDRETWDSLYKNEFLNNQDYVRQSAQNIFKTQLPQIQIPKQKIQLISRKPSNIIQQQPQLQQNMQQQGQPQQINQFNNIQLNNNPSQQKILQNSSKNYNAVNPINPINPIIPINPINPINNPTNPQIGNNQFQANQLNYLNSNGSSIPINPINPQKLSSNPVIPANPANLNQQNKLMNPLINQQQNQPNDNRHQSIKILTLNNQSKNPVPNINQQPSQQQQIQQPSSQQNVTNPQQQVNNQQGSFPKNTQNFVQGNQFQNQNFPQQNQQVVNQQQANNPQQNFISTNSQGQQSEFKLQTNVKILSTSDLGNQTQFQDYIFGIYSISSKSYEALQIVKDQLQNTEQISYLIFLSKLIQLKAATVLQSYYQSSAGFQFNNILVPATNSKNQENYSLLVQQQLQQLQQIKQLYQFSNDVLTFFESMNLIDLINEFKTIYQDIDRKIRPLAQIASKPIFFILKLVNNQVEYPYTQFWTADLKQMAPKIYSENDIQQYLALRL